MSSHLPPGLSPDSIDTLTELATIVAKLRAAQAASSTSVNPAAALLGSLGGATPAPAPGAVTGTTPLPSGAANTSSTTALSVKELPAATDNLKHKLQRARAAIRTLQDVDRGLEQQREEIEELQARRRRQLAMLDLIRSAGLQFSLGEQSKGEEGERMME